MMQAGKEIVEGIVRYFTATFSEERGLEESFLRNFLIVYEVETFYVIGLDMYKELLFVKIDETYTQCSVPEAIQLYNVMSKTSSPSFYCEKNNERFVSVIVIKKILSHYGAVFRFSNGGMNMLFPGFPSQEFLFFNKNQLGEKKDAVIYPMGSEDSSDLVLPNISYITKFYNGTEYGIFFTAEGMTTNHCWCVNQNLEIFFVLKNIIRIGEEATTVINSDPSRYPTMDMLLKFIGTVNTGPRTLQNRFCQSTAHIDQSDVFRIVCSGHDNNLIGSYSHRQRHPLNDIPSVHILGMTRNWYYVEIKEFLSRMIITPIPSGGEGDTRQPVKNLYELADLIEDRKFDKVFRVVTDKQLLEYIAIYSEDFSFQSGCLVPTKAAFTEYLRICLLRTCDFRMDFLENLRNFIRYKYVVSRNSCGIVYIEMLPKICNNQSFTYKTGNNTFFIETNFDPKIEKKIPTLSLVVNLASFMINNMNFRSRELFIFVKALVYYHYKAINSIGRLMYSNTKTITDSLEFIIFKCLRYVASSERVERRDRFSIEVGEDWTHDLENTKTRGSQCLYGSRGYFAETVKNFFELSNFKASTVYRTVRRYEKEIEGYEGFEFDSDKNLYKSLRSYVSKNDANTVVYPLYMFMEEGVLQHIGDEFITTIDNNYIEDIYRSILMEILDKIKREHLEAYEKKDIIKHIHTLGNIRVERNINISKHIGEMDNIISEARDMLYRTACYLAYHYYGSEIIPVNIDNDALKEIRDVRNLNLYKIKVSVDCVRREAVTRDRIEDIIFAKKRVIKREQVKYFDYVFDANDYVLKNINVTEGFIKTSEVLFSLYNKFRTFVTYEDLIGIRDELRVYLGKLSIDFDTRLGRISESSDFIVHDVCESPSVIFFDTVLINSLLDGCTVNNSKDTTLVTQTVTELEKQYYDEIRKFKKAFEEDFKKKINPLYNMFWVVINGYVEASNIDLVKSNYKHYENLPKIEGNVIYDLVSHAKMDFQIYYGHLAIEDRDRKISFHYEQDRDLVFSETDTESRLIDSKFLSKEWSHLERTKFKLVSYTRYLSNSKISVNAYDIVRDTEHNIKMNITKLLSTVFSSLIKH